MDVGTRVRYADTWTVPADLRALRGTVVGVEHYTRLTVSMFVWVEWDDGSRMLLLPVVLTTL